MAVELKRYKELILALGLEYEQYRKTAECQRELDAQKLLFLQNENKQLKQKLEVRLQESSRQQKRASEQEEFQSRIMKKFESLSVDYF